MQLQITSDNLEITPSMHSLAESKVEKFNKYFEGTASDSVSLRVVLNKGAADAIFKVKIDMGVGKLDVYGESKDFSLESALISAVDDVLRQYKKIKEKKNDKEWKENRESKRYPVDDE